MSTRTNPTDGHGTEIQTEAVGAVESLFAGGELIDAARVVSLETEFSVTLFQEETVEKIWTEDEDADEAGNETVEEAAQTARCPNCEVEVAVSVVIQQTRAADEAGTRLYRGTCGCTWRRGN
ncbi:hypothetical protein [Saliphagus infecundisoli]|uniref:TFIIS-type domain-containing protein n=1 Tax=Saliphagus infecundisoli TaxID=1849069 RepID=A0ABD5QIQ4_9EURY|nr:hypothetical protein [Saliphagus infecundisoli]